MAPPAPVPVTGNGGPGVVGALGRVPGMPVVVGGTPPNPHGPLIRGNLVPRLLAPMPANSATVPGGGGGVGPAHHGPVYAIVKPQLAGQPPIRGPPVHVCIPVMHQKMGPGNTQPDVCFARVELILVVV